MENTMLPISLSKPAQKTLPRSKPLSGELFQYHLSRTPTPTRFKRKQTPLPVQVQEIAGSHDHNNNGLYPPDPERVDAFSNIDLFAESDESPRISRCRPAPKLGKPMSSSDVDLSPMQTLVKCQPRTRAPDVPWQASMPQASQAAPYSALDLSDETDSLTLNDAIEKEVAIKKGRPMVKDTEQGIPYVHATADLAQPPSVSASEIPASEPVGKKKLKRLTKRHRPPSGRPPILQSVERDPSHSEHDPGRKTRLRRNLPVDELEVSEERHLAYDAPPMSDFEEAESDPVEEQPADGARPNLAEQHIKRHAKLTKTKRRLKLRRPKTDDWTQYKVLQQPIASTDPGRRHVWNPPNVGDGFEGPERLPMGHTLRPARRRKQAGSAKYCQFTYIRTLDLVETKPYEETAQYGGISPLDDHATHELKVSHEDVHFIAARPYVSPDFDMEQHESLLDAENQGLGAVAARSRSVTEDEPDHQDTITSHTLHGAQSLPVLGGHVHGPVVIGREHQEDLDMASLTLQACSENDVRNASELGDRFEETAVFPVDFVAPPAEHQQEEKAATSEDQSRAQVYAVVENKKAAPPQGKIRRQVTFSDEVEIQTFLEPEYESDLDDEDDDELGSEAQSPTTSSHDSDQESEGSEGSEAQNGTDGEESPDSHGEHDTDDEDEDDDPPKGNEAARIESPELVSSGYCPVRNEREGSYSSISTRGGSPTSSHMTMSQHGENEMIMEEDLLAEQDEECQAPSGSDEMADLDEDMLSLTPRATSPEREPSQGDFDAKEDVGPCDLSSRLDESGLFVNKEAQKLPDAFACTPRSSQSVRGPQGRSSDAGYGLKEWSPKTPHKSAASTPPTSHQRLTGSEPELGVQGQARPQNVPRRIRRAKTGVGLNQRPDPIRHAAVLDVPSYFTQASRALSSPLRDMKDMMRRAKTLPSTQYVSESGDEDGYLVMSDESFRQRLAGRKRHLSFSDTVDDQENIHLKELVERSNIEMGRGVDVGRKRSLPFKSPLKERGVGT